MKISDEGVKTYIQRNGKNISEYNKSLLTINNLLCTYTNM